MSKAKKKHRPAGGIMGRSDIPFAQRIQMQQRSHIAWSREQGARIFMYAFSAAAHQIHGKGYVSLVRFANRFREIDKEVYGSGDIEYSMEDARRRLAQMGITISGNIAVAQNTEGCTRRKMEVKHNIAQATQAAGICATIAANDVWGWADKRLQPVLDLAQEHMHRYAREGTQFLLDYLEKLGFVIVDGHAVGFVDENDQPVRQKVEGL